MNNFKFKFTPVLTPGTIQFSMLFDYHLILSHLFKASQVYSNYYHAAAVGGDLVLVDNGVIENGVADSIEDLVKIWVDMPKSVIVLPDTISNAAKTVLQVEEFVNTYQDKIRENPSNFMIVPQGKDWQEWLECFELLISTHNPYYVGIPRVIEDSKPRRELLEHPTMKKYSHRRKFHMLGIQHSLEEAYSAYRIQGVSGCDSSFPLKMAAAGKIWTPGVEDDCRTLPDWDDKLLNLHTEELILENLRAVRKFFNGD